MGLIIFNDAAGVAEIVADKMRDQLHKGLAIVQDFAFQRVGQDRVGNDQHEDGGEPAREENRDDDVVAREAVAVPSLKVREEWDGLEPRHRRTANSALSPVAASGEMFRLIGSGNREIKFFRFRVKQLHLLKRRCLRGFV